MVHVHIFSSLSLYVLSYLSRPKLPNASSFLLHHDLVYHQVSHATQTQKLPCRYVDMHSMQTTQNINTNTTNVGRFVKAFGFRYFLNEVLRLHGYMQCYLECACMRVLTSEHRVSIGLCKW